MNPMTMDDSDVAVLEFRGRVHYIVLRAKGTFFCGCVSAVDGICHHRVDRFRVRCDSEGMVFDNSPRCGGGLLPRANPPRASRWRDLPRKSLANQDWLGVMLRIHELLNLERPRI